MTSKTKEKVELINNPNINTKFKKPAFILPKPTVLEQNLSLPSTIPSIELESTSKGTTIDLTEVIFYYFLVKINLFNIVINILFYKQSDVEVKIAYINTLNHRKLKFLK